MTQGRLDAELVRRGLVRSRARAREALEEGRVLVDGRMATTAGRRIRPDAELAVLDPDPWVARSAHKLSAALDRFAIAVRGRLCLDVGASTGGFTQVLLERGAREVIALDVGHGQLVPALRADPRVRTVEGANARELDRARLAELAGTAARPELIVVDVSFIPLALVLPALVRVLTEGGEVIALIKPQFEVGRAGIREGVVTERSLRHDAVRAVLRAAAEHGLRTRGLMDSPMLGVSGNREYLTWLAPLGGGDPTEWEDPITALR